MTRLKELEILTESYQTLQDTTGTYNCLVKTSRDEAEQDFVVEVVQAPIIKPFPEEQFVLVGDSINLTCEAYGIPRPEVAWSVGGYSKLMITVREGTDQVCGQ